MIIISLVIVLLDQFTKYLILSFLAAGNSLPVIDNVVYLTLVANRGGAFGLLANYGAFFPYFSFIVIVILTAVILKGPRDAQTFALSLILGGALGNLIDRLRLGFVVDFIDIRIWPVFNLADSAITIGVVLLVWRTLNSKPKTLN